MAKTEDTKTEYKVEGLKEKVVYQFRVKAYNKAGVGEASQPTDNHLCKHRNCKFFFVKFAQVSPITFRKKQAHLKLFKTVIKTREILLDHYEIKPYRHFIYLCCQEVM